MANCNENKGFGKCYSQLWKCEKCGKVGCTREGCEINNLRMDVALVMWTHTKENCLEGDHQ